MITYNLTGKKALVTGAASGIGLATVELLAKSGATVALNDLPDNPALDAGVTRLSEAGYSVHAAPGSTGEPEAAKSMVEDAIDTLGGLDYLVNNAGTPGTQSPIPADDFDSQDEAFWQKLLSVNLLGPYRCTAAARASLKTSGGAIVNTASVAGLRGSGSSSVYCATKAALINLTAEHARALGPEIRVNAIAPGIVESNWSCKFEHEKSYIASLPLQRVGQPEDYAEVIVYLLAGAAYVTGELVVVDGGMLAGSR